MGCEVILFGAAYKVLVSIHAPVWGAKSVLSQINEIGSVSIHAPVWGANNYLINGEFVSKVSIHAPVWGANILHHSVYSFVSFNPRTRVGCE